MRMAQLSIAQIKVVYSYQNESPERHDRDGSGGLSLNGGFVMEDNKSTYVTTLRLPTDLKEQVREIAGKRLGPFLLEAAQEKLDSLQNQKLP